MSDDASGMLSLFDQPDELPAIAHSEPSGNVPDSHGLAGDEAPGPGAKSPDPGPAGRFPTTFRRALATLAAESQNARSGELSPRADRVWLSRDGGRYLLQHARIERPIPVSPAAIRDLALLMDVRHETVQELSTLAKAEDCRLLNLLLWVRGRDPEFTINATELNGEIVAFGVSDSPVPSPLDILLALEIHERRSSVRAQRVDRHQACVWVEVIHDDIPTIDGSPGVNRDSLKPDVWRAGSLIVSTGSDGGAIHVVPALFRDWGSLCLPFLTSRRRRTRFPYGGDVDRQLDMMLGAVDETRTAPFELVPDWLRPLHERAIARSDVGGEIDALRLSRLHDQAKDLAIRSISARRPTAYRLAAGVLSAARDTADIAERLSLHMQAGRALWAWGGGPGLLRSMRRQPTKRPQGEPEDGKDAARRRGKKDVRMSGRGRRVRPTGPHRTRPDKD